MLLVFERDKQRWGLPVGANLWWNGSAFSHELDAINRRLAELTAGTPNAALSP